MDWADDITYAVHDMEDFYRAGLIPLERLHAHGSYDHASSPMTPDSRASGRGCDAKEVTPRPMERHLASDPRPSWAEQLMSL